MCQNDVLRWTHISWVPTYILMQKEYQVSPEFYYGPLTLSFWKLTLSPMRLRTKFTIGISNGIIIAKKKRIRFKNTPRSIHSIHSHIAELLPLAAPPACRIFLTHDDCAVPFFFVVRPENSPKTFLTWWPSPLTYDLWTWPRYSSTWPTCRIPGPYVCPFVR